MHLPCSNHKGPEPQCTSCPTRESSASSPGRNTSLGGTCFICGIAQGSALLDPVIFVTSLVIFSLATNVSWVNTWKSQLPFINKWVSHPCTWREKFQTWCQTAEVNHKSPAFLWWQWDDLGVAWLLIEEHLELSNVCVTFKCPICLKKGEECILMWPEQGSLGWISEYLLQNEHCSHGAFHKDFWRGQLSPRHLPLGKYLMCCFPLHALLPWI